MKYITLIIGLLVIGCDSFRFEYNPSGPENMRRAKEKARHRVVGEYEFKKDGDTTKLIFLENGIQEWYENGKKQQENEWYIGHGVLYVIAGGKVFQPNPKYQSGKLISLTVFADVITYENLKYYPKEKRRTYIRIK